MSTDSEKSPPLVSVESKLGILFGLVVCVGIAFGVMYATKTGVFFVVTDASGKPCDAVTHDVVNGVCLEKCELGSFRVRGSEYCDTCEPTTHDVFNDECVPKCAEGKLRNLKTGECVTCDRTKYDLIDGECVLKCPARTYRESRTSLECTASEYCPSADQETIFPRIGDHTTTPYCDKICNPATQVRSEEPDNHVCKSKPSCGWGAYITDACICGTGQERGPTNKCQLRFADQFEKVKDMDAGVIAAIALAAIFGGMFAWWFLFSFVVPFFLRQIGWYDAYESFKEWSAKPWFFERAARRAYYDDKKLEADRNSGTSLISDPGQNAHAKTRYAGKVLAYLQNKAHGLSATETARIDREKIAFKSQLEKKATWWDKKVAGVVLTDKQVTEKFAEKIKDSYYRPGIVSALQFDKMTGYKSTDLEPIAHS